MYTTLKPDRNRQRTVVFYGRVSTEHEAQISALENQLQWYDDQAKQHNNWNVIDKYIDEVVLSISLDTFYSNKNYAARKI
ncbi:hypothetical protein [Ruminococcus sp.]|jgi:predicted site-specific integrase-resolvase|uniref:hypothetical protein n=1 Tax=Ruminococcus sp. TaxID=41978 RepID=UPI003AAA60C0